MGGKQQRVKLRGRRVVSGLKSSLLPKRTNEFDAQRYVPIDSQPYLD